MNHQDHVDLLLNGIPHSGGTWADFGAGDGAFTLALADLIGSGGVIHAIDSSVSALNRNTKAMERFPRVMLHTHQEDFTRNLNLPPLDGIVMANALHFVERRHQLVTVKRLRAHLKTDGCFILVEYDVDRGNNWVPHPLSYTSWEKLSAEAGFTQTRFLARKPSRFLKAIYSAVSR
jgi:ubiquinone/menaquinone biosynthesis C-methylase UbiE